MNRRSLLESTVGLGAGMMLAREAQGLAATPKYSPGGSRTHPAKIPCADGTGLYVQELGAGRPIVWVSAWTLDSRFWGSHIAALATAGFRCIAFDRRGHGRSDAPSVGYDANTLAADLWTVLEAYDVRDAVLVAHSIGAGEAVRCLSTHGQERVAKLVLVAPTTPYIVKAPDNPEGVPETMVDAMLAEISRDFPKWVADNEAPFFVPETIAETRTWIKTMMLGVPLPLALSFRKQAGSTDFRPDVAAVKQPTLILHGDKDQSAPLALTGARTAKLMRDAKLIVYENAPHALPLTHSARFLADVETFARG